MSQVAEPSETVNDPSEGDLASLAAAVAGLAAVVPRKSADARSTAAMSLAGDALVVPPVPRPPRRRHATRATAFLSLLLHSSCLLAFLHWWGQAELGVLDRPTDAISVEIVESSVLEAMLQKNKPEPPPAVAATAPAGNADADTKAAELKAPKVVEKPPDKMPDAVADPVPKVEPDPPLEAPPDRDTRVVNAEPPEKPPAEPVPVQGPGEKKEAPAADENTVAVRKDPEPLPKPDPEEKPPPVAQQPEPEPKPKTQEAQEKTKPEKSRRDRPKQATRAGGVTARAHSGDGTGAPRPSASAGAVLGYAAAVRARVAGNKPSGAGQRGTALVSFGVTPSGGLAYASIARSSGNSALDRLALSAVRSSRPFPSPPAGATPAQLRFSIPFHFQ